MVVSGAKYPDGGGIGAQEVDEGLELRLTEVAIAEDMRLEGVWAAETGKLIAVDGIFVEDA